MSGNDEKILGVAEEARWTFDDYRDVQEARLGWMMLPSTDNYAVLPLRGVSRKPPDQDYWLRVIQGQAEDYPCALKAYRLLIAQKFRHMT